MTIELPFPAKILWPNGRGHHMARHRAAKKHRQWAHDVTLAALGGKKPVLADRIRLSITVYPKTRNAIDFDNALAAQKAYLDGIALALKVDDKRFDLPQLQFGEPVKDGRVVVDILP
jgi:crossover junction endodeoxyribonuclease RusA